MATALPIFSSFPVHEAAAEIRWRKWLNRLENMLVGMDIKDVKRKRALLLHYAGEDVNDIFETLTDTGDDYATSVTKLTKYFAPKKNTEYEIYKFRQCRQSSNETMDSFHTKLRQLAITCDFAENDKEIKSQIVQGCHSTRLRRRALREEISLQDLISLGRAQELSDKQACVIESNSNTHQETACKIKTYRKGQKNKTVKFQPKQTCRNCGGTYPHIDRPCPAKGKSCNICKKLNHFGKMCKSNTKAKKYVKTIGHDSEQSDSSDTENYLFGIQTDSVNAVKSRQPKMMVTVNGLKIQMLVDTGASINIMDEITYDNYKRKPKLIKTTKKAFVYGSENSLQFMGQFNAEIETKEKITTAEIYVVKGKGGNLLCYETCLDLQIVPTISIISENKSEELCKRYQHVFEGMGKMKDVEVKLHIDETVKPVTQPHRRIPFHVRKQVESELKRLEKLDIIEKVNGPTPWVSPIVVAPKPKRPDQIRMGVDMIMPNKAILRERHIIPTVEDMILDLNGATVFSKLDLNGAYHQLLLSEDSRNITTFTTHVGLRRYKRLSFGISSAAEIFQNTLRTALEGLDGVKNISDDIIVYGKTQLEHDICLEATLKRLSDLNLTLSKDKCEFNKNKLEFYGHIFSKDGMSADPKKVDTIKNTATPTNVSEVRSFLAMTNYVSRFIPEYSTITEPLRALTKQTVQWKWNVEQQTAFDKLKQSLTSDRVIAYFDPRKDTSLIVDASPVGLGALLTQDGKVIAYASKALTDVETRYSQTEKEGLAIVWACEHFNLYLFGHSFTLVSDHQPLETIFNNPKSKPPARIERWRLRLQKYDFNVKYKAGKTNAADYISRHPDKANFGNKHSNIAEEYCSYVSENAVPKAMTIDDICEATSADIDLQNVIATISNGNWEKSYNDKVMNTFSRLRNEITVVNVTNGKVVLCNNRLVIPKSLQLKIVLLAHEGHQGIVKTKQLLREKVWFVGIDKQVEELCKSCIPCLASTPKKTSEPLVMSELPTSPWTEVSIDFAGPFSNSTYLIVVMDDYSRYPVVEIISSTSAKAVIPVLDKILSLFGVIDIARTDNGAPFNSSEFRQFSEYMGFKHRKITPIWPQANGECERFMRSIGKAVKAATVENKNWKQELNNFLRNYRATPHSTTNVSPSELMFGRNINTRLPHLTVKSKDKDVRRTDKRRKQYMKTYADNRRNSKPSKLKVGDKVLVKQDKRGKLIPPFNPNPYQITKKKGTMVTAEREDHKITRNSSFFKQVHKSPTIPPKDDGEFNENTDITDNTLENSEPFRRSERVRKPPSYLKDYECKT